MPWCNDIVIEVILVGFRRLHHLRWDLKQIFDMAVAEDLIRKNPAELMFTPAEAKRGPQLVMTI